MSFLIILTLILVLVFAVLWVKRSYSFWHDRGFLQADGSFPLGSFQGVGRERTAYEAMRSMYEKFKGTAPLVGHYAFMSPNVLLLEPELIKNVLTRDFSYFHDRPFYHNRIDDPLSVNVVSLEGQEWKDRRVKLTPMFSSAKMKMMFEIIDTIGDKFALRLSEELSESREQEMRSWAQRFTADNIGNVAFGLECSCLDDPNSEFMRNGRRLFDLSKAEMIKSLFVTNFPNVARKLGLRQNAKEVSDFFLSTFLQTFEHCNKNNVKRNDFVSMLLELRGHFTPTELAAESLVIFGAGYETSSTLMTFALYELALNPRIQQRLREEMSAGVEENDGKLTYEMLFAFKYLDMVINETLRKYPPIPDNGRKCTQDYQVPGTKLVVPKDSLAIISTFGMQNDPEYFTEPEKFDPERFSDENVTKIKQFTFLPFGGGARQCLGMRFGLMQSKMGIAKLITNFSFSPCEKTTIPMKFVASAPFLSPMGGMWLKVEKLN